MMRINALSMAVLLAASLGSALAYAEPSVADRATARTLAMSGFAALDQRDFATAADHLERAVALYSAPTLLLGLGKARVGLGQLVGAQDALGRAANVPITADTSPAFRKAIEDARVELQALNPRIPSVTIVVQGPKGTKVTLDDVEVPEAALGVPRPVDPGRHMVRALLPGAPPSEAAVILTEGKAEKVVLKVEGSAAPEADKLPAGPVPGIAPAVTQPSGGSPTAPVASSSSGRKTLAWSTIGVGGAGLLAGGIFGGLAMSKHGDVTSQCSGSVCPANLQSKLQSDVDSYKSMAMVSTVSFIVGGVIAAAGGVLLVTAPTTKPQAASWTPVVGVGYLGAQGRF